MVEFLMWCLPAVICARPVPATRDLGTRRALDRVGATWAVPSAYGWAALLAVGLVALAWAATLLIPIQIVRQLASASPMWARWSVSSWWC